MDDFDTKELRIALDLPHFGELVAAIIKRYAEVAGVDSPSEDDEWREIMRHAWDYCLFMADRVQMAKTSLADLDALPVYAPPAEQLGATPSPFDRPLDTRRLSDRERAARRPSEKTE